MPRASAEILQQEFLAMRSKLIDLAAQLDRIDRGEGGPPADPRLEQIRQAAALLVDGKTERAERMQLLFSLPYAENWRAEYGIAR